MADEVVAVMALVSASHQRLWTHPKPPSSTIDLANLQCALIPSQNVSSEIPGWSEFAGGRVEKRTLADELEVLGKAFTTAEVIIPYVPMLYQ